MFPLPPAETLVAALARRGFLLPPGPVIVGDFGDSPELSRQLLDLIRAGPKRAGTSLLWALEHDDEPLPEVGCIEIVVDHTNEPALVTRLTSVRVVPFKEVSPEYAAIEGEGDGSLQYWREGHWAFFSRECQRIGRVPTEEMPVVCSTFDLLFVCGPDSTA